MSDFFRRIFDPLLDLSARALSFLYDVWPNYAGAILLLTVCVMTVLTPITIRSTKSMLAMRRLAPQTKQLQAQYRHDRQKMNEEVMALYRANSVNPLGGCLPLLMQSPVFIALFQLLRGLTRRTSVLGWSSSQAAATCAAQPGQDCAPQLAAAPKQKFNPDYLNTDSQLYRDLVESTEMRAWGLDLAESANSALRSSFVSGLPYLGMILLVAALGYYQQRQISGRMSADEQTPQARMMMRIIPVFLPVISFGLSAGLVLYYNAQSLIRIGQQALITRRIYRPFAAEEAVRKALEEEAGEEEAAVPVVVKTPEEPRGLAGRLGLARPPDPRRHGRQRPISGAPPKPKPAPPAARVAAAPPARATAQPPSRTSSRRGGADSRREAQGRSSNTNRRSKEKDAPPPKPLPSRVTPKGAQQRRRKRNKK